MRSKRLTTRSLAVLLCAGAVSLGVAAGAAAVIYVYGNGFSKKSAFKEIKRTGGSKKCDREYREKSNQMAISLTGKRLCDFSPPVVGDAAQPDHVIYAKGRMNRKRTPKALRRAAYLAVRVRNGHGGNYELQIFPTRKRFKLVRNPAAEAVSERGRSRAINAGKKPNALRLAVDGARVTGFVNGRKLASVVDPNPGGVNGRKTSFGLGSRKDGKRRTVGSFKRVRVGIAE